jgi:hypothetical protein
MKRIKVTAYMDPDDLNEEYVDLDHDMGLSNDGYEFYAGVTGETPLGPLGDIEFELVDED